MSNRCSQLPVEVLVGNLPAVDLRVSQLPVETLLGNLPAVTLRVSQLPVEVLLGPASAAAAQLSQLPVEVLLEAPPQTQVHLSQLPLEVLRLPPSTAEAQLSQLPLEVLTPAPPAEGLVATHLVTEVAQQQPSAIEATQIATEVAHRQPQSAIDVTHVVVEVARDRRARPASALTVSQLCIEIIRVPRPPGEPGSPEEPDANPACLDASTRLVNLALAALGNTDFVSNYATEASRNAATARLHYGPEMDAVLRAHPWKFATRYATLARLGGSLAAPDSGDWVCRYRVPADCLYVRRIVPDARQRTFDPAPVAFDVSDDDGPDSRVLLANTEAVEIEYTARLVCPARVRDPLFRRACTWRLASAFAQPLGRDPAQREACLARYQEQITLAAARDQGEQQPQHPPHVGDAAWTRAREDGRG